MPFTNVIAPGDKDFDFDINQVSITEDRKTAADFSSSHYDVKQVMIMVKGSNLTTCVSKAFHAPADGALNAIRGAGRL